MDLKKIRIPNRVMFPDIVRDTVSLLVQFSQDTNDNTPLFAKSAYPVEIYENITSGSVILQLSAQDQDLGVNTGLRYYIVSGNTLGRFFIDSYSGVLYVKSPIDRDPPRNENAFLLTV